MILKAVKTNQNLKFVVICLKIKTINFKLFFCIKYNPITPDHVANQIAAGEVVQDPPQ
jgi:hypothetical protein